MSSIHTCSCTNHGVIPQLDLGTGLCKTCGGWVNPVWRDWTNAGGTCYTPTLPYINASVTNG